MIVSINLKTEHGTPGWLSLDKSGKSQRITFRSKTNEKIEAYLGHFDHHSDNGLPIGIPVKKSALKREPWIFSPKTLYLSASAMMMQSNKGEQFNHQIELGHSLVLCALASGNDLYAFIIVEPSTDERYDYWPVLVESV